MDFENHIKKDRLKIDVDRHLQQCAQKEINTSDGNRQKFIDRVQKCIAGLEDTHFWATPLVQRPYALTAILAAESKGKIYIASQSALLIARIKQGNDALSDLETTLAPGNEITKIEGIPAKDAIAGLAPYASASSPAFATQYAALRFFARDFRYPNKRTVDLEIKTSRGTKHVTLPWFSALTQGDLDAQDQLNRLGLPKLNELALKFDPVQKKFDKDMSFAAHLYSKGFSITDPLFANSTRLTTYLDDHNTPGLRTGEVIVDAQGGRLFCYMQLSTFNTVNFHRKNSPKDLVPFIKPIEIFVSTCEQKHMPLVLDLKYNGGGNGNFPPLLLSTLARSNETYGGSVIDFRATQSVDNLLTSMIDPDSTVARNLDNGADLFSSLSVLGDALKSAQDYADILNVRDVSSGNTGGTGFNQKVLAIVSPFCISACDMTARLLRNSKRAIIFGSASNGTGGGYESSQIPGGNTLDSTFMDTDSLFKFEIPNFMFGVETASGQPQRLPFDRFESLITENDPTIADTDARYDLDANDFANGGQDLMKAVVNRLFSN